MHWNKGIPFRILLDVIKSVTEYHLNLYQEYIFLRCTDKNLLF